MKKKLRLTTFFILFSILLLNFIKFLIIVSAQKRFMTILYSCGNVPMVINKRHLNQISNVFFQAYLTYFWQPRLCGFMPSSNLGPTYVFSTHVLFYMPVPLSNVSVCVSSSSFFFPNCSGRNLLCIKMFKIFS